MKRASSWRSTISIASARAVPLLADLKPSGRFVATDLHAAGGSRLVAKRLLEAGVLSQRRADGQRAHHRRRGRAGRRNARARRSSGRSDRPIKRTGGLVIVRGNLAPEGAVIKVSGRRAADRTAARRASSTARKRRSRPSSGRQIRPGDVVVIRYEGPSGGPGHARDARRDGRADGRGAGRFGGPRHRRAVLGRHARADGRPCRAGSVPRRPAGARFATAT